MLEYEALYELLDVMISEQSLIEAVDQTQIRQDPKALNLQTHSKLAVLPRAALDWEIKDLDKVLW